jgi:hypothetical protein
MKPLPDFLESTTALPCRAIWLRNVKAKSAWLASNHGHL